MGFVSFDSERPHINNTPPPVVIKQLLVNNHPIKLKEHDFLHEATVLDYQHSNITITYRALNYIHQEETLYTYQLEGFDQNEIQAGNRLEAHYTNLPAGKYRFRVNAANSNGVWNETGASILITILPPPWKTWWAYILYVLVFFGLIAGYLRYIHVRNAEKHLIARINNLIASHEHLKNIYGKNFPTQDIGSEITSADDRFLQKLYKVMEENISNPELNIEKFCKEIGMSKTNLYNKIKSLTNLSATEFARLTRLQYAAKILKEKKVPVSEVYVLAGFNSHSYFSNCFRALYGVTPSEYAKKMDEKHKPNT
jgi:AraC-like DNA-binding protein